MQRPIIFSILTLFVIASGLIFVTPAYADVTVSAPPGSAVPGCEETNECYIPADVTISVGETVTWSNDDTAAHTVTSGTAEGGPDGNFDSSLFMSGNTFTVTFEEEGVFPYFCMVHPWMVGTVTVAADAMEEEHMEDDHMEHMDDEGHLITDASATGMLSDGTEVKIWTSEPMTGERMEVHVEFVDSEHVNHDITVTQNGETVLDDMGAHHHGGSGMHETAPLSSADPVDVTITFTGYGIDEMTGPVGEVVTFTNVVPEFGTIAAMILAVAIVSIIAVTARSKLSLTPRI